MNFQVNRCALCFLGLPVLAATLTEELILQGNCNFNGTLVPVMALAGGATNPGKKTNGFIDAFQCPSPLVLVSHFNNKYMFRVFFAQNRSLALMHKTAHVYILHFVLQCELFCCVEAIAMATVAAVHNIPVLSGLRSTELFGMRFISTLELKTPFCAIFLSVKRTRLNVHSPPLSALLVRL